MKKLIIFVLLLLCFGFSAVSSFGGIALQDVQTISSSTNCLNELIVTSRNAFGAVVSTGYYRGLSNQYSVWLFASQSATLNVQLRTTGVTDGQIKILATTGFSKPVVINTRPYINVNAFMGATQAYVVQGADTASITFTGVGQAKILQYKASLGRYVVIGTQKTADIFTF